MTINGGFCMLLLHLACNSSLQAVFPLCYAKRVFPLKRVIARAWECCIAEFLGLGLTVCLYYFIFLPQRIKK